MAKKKETKTVPSCDTCAHKDDVCEDCEKKDLWEAGTIANTSVSINGGPEMPFGSPEAKAAVDEMVAKAIGAEPVKSHPANDPPKCSNALGIPDYQLHVGRGDKVAWKVSLESTRWKMSISHKSLRELEHAADDYLQDIVRSKLRVQPDMKILAGEYDLMVATFATKLKELAYKAAREYAVCSRMHMEYPDLPALDSD